MRSVHFESITTTQFKENIKPHLDDKSSEKRLQALVRTANCLMNDVEVGNIYMDIVKISDTRKKMQKLYISYILQLLSKNSYYENLLILNTNTLLKDLNDTKTDLVVCALDFVGQTRFMDEYVAKYFVNLSNGNDLIRNIVAKNIWVFFENDAYVKKLQLKKVLSEMCNDENNVWALNSAYKLLPKYNILDDYDIIKMYKVASLERKLLLLMIINKKIELKLINAKCYDKIKTMCCGSLCAYNIEIVYLASKVLLNIDNEYSQRIYDTLICYINNNDANSFFILEFIRNMVLLQKAYDFEYANSDFIVFSGDCLDIKKMKFDILCINYDTCSHQQIISNIKDSDLFYDIIYVFVHKKIYDQKLLKKCLDGNIDLTLQIIGSAMPLSEEWKQGLLEMLDYIIMSNGNKDNVLQVASEIIRDDTILENTDLSIIQKYNLYTGMYRRGYLSKDNFAKKMNWKGKINEDFDRLIEKTDAVTHNVFVENALKTEMFSGYTFTKNCEQKKPFYADLIGQKYDLTAKSILYEYIDQNISLNIELGENTLILNITRVELETHVIIDGILDKTFSKKHKEILRHITIYDLPISLRIDINDIPRKISLGLHNLLLPSQSDIKDFNENFCNLKCYEILDAKKFNYDKYKIESNLFVCDLLGHVIYGMEMCGQIILKSDEKAMLKRFIESLE